MPEFAYAGQVPRSYPDLRDAQDVIVGTVEHGDTRKFGTEGAAKPEGAPAWWPAPDDRWVPAGEELAPAWPGVSAGMYRDGPEAEDEPEAETHPQHEAGPVTPAAMPDTTTAPDGQTADGANGEE